MTTLAPESTGTTHLTDDDGLCHLVCCCNEDLSFCGKDVTTDPWTDGTLPYCVVCDDLWPDGIACPRCGCVECADIDP